MALTKVRGIVDSGEAVAAGVGATRQRRIHAVCIQRVKAGLYQSGEVRMLKAAPPQSFDERVGQDRKAQRTKRR